MKRALISLAMSSMLLTSCSGFNPTGTYEFRLGKTDGNHLEVTAVVTNEKQENKEGYKKMKLTADLGSEMSPASLLEAYADQYPILAPFITIIETEVKNIDGIPMYYKVLNYKDAKYGRYLSIGSDIVKEYVDKLKDKYPSIKELLDELGITDEKLDVSPEKLRYILGAYVNDKTLTFQIPVSTEDLELQMFWYGKSPLIATEYVDKMPGEKGDKRFGSHPITKTVKGQVVRDDVAEVNKTFENEFSNTHLYQGENVEIGSFVEEVVDNKKQLKLYLKDSYTGSHDHIEGYVMTKGGLGEYDVKKDIKLSVDDNHMTNVTYNGKEGKEEGFADENGMDFQFNLLMQTPFVFRDFHVVNVGLTKL